MTAQEKGITFYIVITAHYIDLPANKQARKFVTRQNIIKKFKKKKKKRKEKKLRMGLNVTPSEYSKIHEALH